MLFAILRLERIKKVAPDQTLIADSRELSYQTGTNKRYIKQGLITLEAYGLLTVEIGKPQYWSIQKLKLKK
jgi:hypothetical protein